MTDTNDQPPPPDDQTFSMFGDGEDSAKKTGYLVLARKYRPRTFEDLVGQDAMVRTLSNAFKTGRIAHAFMLTGVRGVGKTTTARLLARALNYETDETSGPSIHLDPLGQHCEAIIESRHPDVLELDAASRTGVADMRELLDGVRYAPVSAPYKVYIIDEVHMLSTQSFNALLKTLEEPPPHAKFIFATTEIRKVPITVLSRCQRFDLRRLTLETLTTHLANICRQEGIEGDTAALQLIARAAEGSVRDGLSILDQAIVQSEGQGLADAETVRDMLGLADRNRLLDLYGAAVSGDHKTVLDEYGEQISGGADPTVLIRELMDVCADVNRRVVLGDDYTPTGPDTWINSLIEIAANVSAAQGSRYWQILLNGLEQCAVTPDPETAVEMTLLRLSSAASLPSPEDAAKAILENRSGTRADGTSESPAPSSPGGPAALQGPGSFDAIIDLLRQHKKADLLYEAERHVRPAKVGANFMSLHLTEEGVQTFPGRLKTFLEKVTGQSWTVELVQSERETVEERRQRDREARIDRARTHPDVQKMLETFPGATIEDVEEPDTDSVVEVDFANRQRKGTG